MLLLLTLLTLLLLLTLLYLIYYPPRALFDWFQRRHPNVIFHLPLPPGQRIVALTIDDAPSAHTPALLDLLAAHGAHATFFIIGDQVAPPSSPPGLLARMIAEGHEVGNHCWTDEKTVLRAAPEVARQVRRVEALLPPNGDGRRWFRPGGGFFSASMVRAVEALGYRTVLGCVYPHDPQVWSPAVNARHVLSMVREGGIIILHDRRAWSVRQLELILVGLRREGWEVVRLGRLLDIWEGQNGKRAM